MKGEGDDTCPSDADTIAALAKGGKTSCTCKGGKEGGKSSPEGFKNGGSPKSSREGCKEGGKPSREGCRDRPKSSPDGCQSSSDKQNICSRSDFCKEWLKRHSCPAPPRDECAGGGRNHRQGNLHQNNRCQNNCCQNNCCNFPVSHLIIKMV